MRDSLLEGAPPLEMIAPMIARRIARNDPVGVTLQALLDELVNATGSGLMCAVLLYRNGCLEAAANNGLDPIDLRELCTTKAGLSRPQEVAGFSFRPLVSGATEFLGILAFKRDSVPTPFPDWDRMIAAHQAMAGLAIEHANLIEELTWKAQHDSLTNVGNRSVFEDCLAETLTQARNDDEFAGLISINIDRFRMFNEVLGNDIGDAILRQVARRFTMALDGAGTLTRTGGDEFQVVLPCLASPVQAVQYAHRLARELSNTFQIGDHELSVTASIGVSVFSQNICTPKDLESTGHSAVQRAKRSGGNCVIVYEPSMTIVPPERLKLEQSLRVAVRNQELLVHYQPQVELNSGKLTGTEALLRWHHPKLGLVSPANFIAIAEESGMIGALAHWLIAQAVCQYKKWIDSGLEPIRLGLNVSPIQFANPTFALDFLTQIKEFGMNPANIELEITETALMHDFPLARKHIYRLREEGFAFSLDDFGTGHSNLAYLRDLPVQCLKIDREFVTPIRFPSDRPALLENVISLGHALKVRTIAEGVETAIQAEALRMMGCDEGQGYLYSRPLPGRDLLEWAKLRARPDRPPTNPPVSP